MTINEWARRHAESLGFRNADDLAMLTRWAAHFAASGYTPEELCAATDAIMRDPPEYRAEHLALIHKAVRAYRGRAAPPAPEEDCSCPLCRGTGRVSVPNVRRSPDGGATYWEKWHSTALVLCGCTMGRWYQGANAGQQTLANYQLGNPRWKDQLDAHAAEQRRLRELSEEAGARDRVAGALARRWRLPRGE